MWQTTCTQGNQDSRLLMIESQIANLTLDLSFDHNLCLKYPNGWCKPILDIYVPRSFQWHKELFNSMNFDSYHRLLKVWKSIRTPTPKMGVHLGMWGFIPSHFLAFLGAWNVTPKLHSWPTSFASPCLGHKPKFSIVTHVTFLHFKRSMSSLTLPLWSQFEHNHKCAWYSLFLHSGLSICIDFYCF